MSRIPFCLFVRLPLFFFALGLLRFAMGSPYDGMLLIGAGAMSVLKKGQAVGSVIG
jgi:hypothetical protein